VAGLRNRPDHDVDEQVEQVEQKPDQPRDEPTEGTVSGVLNGVLGEPPTRTEPAEPVESTEPAEPAEPADEDTGEPAVETAAITAAKPRPAAGTTRPKSRPTGAEGDRRPAGKRRATGAARPTDLADAETGAGAEPPRPTRYPTGDRAPRSKASSQVSVAIILVVVAIVFVGLAVFFRGKANELSSGDAGNTALTDSAATSQVKGQLTTAVQQTFSYNYTDLDATAKAVKENLTGKALCEYNLLFGEVKQYAPEQKIVLRTTVHELAVVRIDGDRAEALVYIDQLSTRVDVNKTVAVEGQFAVQAKRDGDHWKITEFDMFGQPLFNGKPAPKC
jgi:Mce-associated membrane protein